MSLDGARRIVVDASLAAKWILTEYVQTDR